MMCPASPEGLGSIVLAPGEARHRDFVRRLSEEAFSRFGDYGELLAETMDWPWVRTVVAERAGVPIGFAMVSLEDLLDGELDLIAIAVEPQWQSHGVGRRLLTRAEQDGRTHLGRRRGLLRLTVAVDNVAAHALFESAGYESAAGPEGSYPRGQPSIAFTKQLR